MALFYKYLSTQASPESAYVYPRLKVVRSAVYVFNYITSHYISLTW